MAAELRLQAQVSTQSHFRFFDVAHGQLARLDQMRHDRLCPPAEQPEQIVDEPSLRRFARDHCLEDMRITDFLGTSEHVLGFQAIHHGLHRGVGRPPPLGKRIMDFPDGARAVRPQGFHDGQFQLTELRRRQGSDP
jgi:hypothetical protein